MNKSRQHLIQRNHIWYARLSIPKDVRAKLGRKREYIQSLKTGDINTAEVRKNLLIAEWKNAINMARGSASAIESQAIRLRNDDGAASDRVNPLTGMSDKDYYAESIAESLDENEQEQFYNYYTGRVGTPFEYFAEDFIKYTYPNPKTAQDVRSSLRMFAEFCPTLTDVKKRRVLKWLETETRARNTVSKKFSHLSNYWKYLQSRELVDIDLHPFYGVELPKSLRKTESREPFTDQEIKSIFEELEKLSDDVLTAACSIAIYTGARVSEIGALRVDDVVTLEGVKCIQINNAKTSAGNRIVPIHPKLLYLIFELLQGNEDEFLISKLKTKRDAKDRGDIISKRFARLIRSKLELPKSKVFHSFRNTVATKLESAGIPENIAADIIGHDKDTMTYGLYSGGTSIKQRYEAIKKIGYYL